MKRILIPLCLVLGSHLAADAQRSYQSGTPEQLFVEGKEMFSLKNYSGCIDKLEAYKSHSADADLIQEADYMLVYAAFQQGRPNSDELLKMYLETYPDSRHADVINYLIGSTHFGKGEYEKAIYWLEESNIDMLNAEEQEAYSFRLAYSLLQTGDRKQAYTYFNRIKQVGHTYKDAAAYYVAYIDYADGKYNQALVEFEEMKNRPAYKEQSSYYITQIYFIQNKYKQVVKEGESLLVDYPQSKNKAELYRLVGNSSYHLGNEAKALKMLAQYAAETDAPLRSDLYLLGVCYFNQGDYKNAVNSLGKVVSENDALTQNAYLYLGQSYLKLNDKNNARMAFEAAATASYDKQIQEAAMYNYALLIHETAFTGFGESVTIFEDFLNDFPNSQYADKVNDYLVEVYLTTKNYEAALKSIQKIQHPSVKILDAKQNILFQLGTEAFTNMKLDDAILLFTQAIQMGTYNEEARSDAYFWRGESYYRKGEYENAISDYRTYQNNTKQKGTDMYPLSFYGLGYCYFKQQEYDSALNRFRQYVDVESNHAAASYADAYNRIGDCLFRNRLFAAAEENYSRASQILPSAGDYSFYQKGFVLGLQKDYQGKIKAMDQLISQFPESQYVDDALFEKGRSYVLLNNDASAAQTFQKLIQEYPESSLARKAGIQLGLIYYNANQPEKAAAEYKRVISNYPGSEEAKVALQDLKSVYIDLNDIESYAAYVNSLGGNVHMNVNEQDSLTYIAAEKLFMRGDNEGARRSMQNYLRNYPDGAFSTNANFYLASIAFNLKEYDDALSMFQNVINSGDRKFLEESWARKAEIEYLSNDFAAGLESFKRLNEVAENQDNKEAASLGLMRCALKVGNQKEALNGANLLLKNPKLSPEVANEARYVRAKAYMDMGQESKALADLKLISKDTRTVQGAEAKYLLAQLYYDSNDDKNAEKILEEFAKNGTPHQYWLARGFILWADIYIRKNDPVQARVYLNSLKKNYQGDDNISEMIESRLAKLK